MHRDYLFLDTNREQNHQISPVSTEFVQRPLTALSRIGYNGHRYDTEVRTDGNSHLPGATESLWWL